MTQVDSAWENRRLATGFGRPYRQHQANFFHLPKYGAVGRPCDMPLLRGGSQRASPAAVQREAPERWNLSRKTLVLLMLPQIVLAVPVFSSLTAIRIKAEKRSCNGCADSCSQARQKACVFTACSCRRITKVTVATGFCLPAMHFESSRSSRCSCPRLRNAGFGGNSTAFVR